jgi:hypothetical protein
MHVIRNLATIPNQPSVHPMVRPNQVLSPRMLEFVVFTLPTLRVPALFELRKLSHEGALLSDTASRRVKSGAEPAGTGFKWAGLLLRRPPCVALRRSDVVDWRAVEG